MMRIENTAYRPVRYRGADGTACHAYQVVDGMQTVIAAWVKGHTWVRGVVVPLVVDGVRYEAMAEPGEWVYTLDGTHFSVASDAGFRAEFAPVTR